ncbi:MAG TPA: MBL fold metallo-hydrolase [Vicinamibacterales bacterium]|jgi:hydroxyacylglutathione hydrolase
MFSRFYDDGLAQASFVVGCHRTKRAVVVDPRRDAAIYVEAARQAGATIVAVIETHVHADFVSGARELASIGLPVITGPGAALAYEHHEVRDHETLQVGDLGLTFLHTPGHTFEHIAILAEAPGEAARLFTGDLLFVGGVGRPDLLGERETRALAGMLHQSLRRVAALDPSTEVHPGHGAGSLCGAGIGLDPSSTIGREWSQNPLLRDTPDQAFVEAVLADLPDTPPYFARMKRLNLAPDVLGLASGTPALPSIRPAAAAALAADGAIVIDLRPAAEFAAGHPDGAINLAYGAKVGYWAGWVLPPDAPLILFGGSAGQAADAAMQLRRIGLDRIEGMVDGGFSAWQAASLPVASIQQVDAEALRARDDLYVVDVRSAHEWRADHAPGAVNIPVGDLPARVGELPPGRTIATICEGGYRSSLASSLLAQEGIAVVNVAGGMAAYRGSPQSVADRH